MDDGGGMSERATIAYTGERAVPGRGDLYAFRRIYSLVSERFGAADRDVLDYGCGTGYGTLQLSASFRSVVGIDVDPDTIEYCGRTHHAKNLRFELLDPTTQPFPDDSYDCVFSFQVLEHVPSDLVGGYLRNIHNMLRPGGVGVITTPKSENYYGGHSGNPFHVKEYSCDALRGLLTQVLPAHTIQILSIEDVLSTRVRVRIVRAGRGRTWAKVLARLASTPVMWAERAGLIRTDHSGMVKEGSIAPTVGSYYIEVHK
jgi:SAM-dependent methyltransferase